MYEIELKSLLVTPEKASQVREKILEMGATFVGKEKQLNHYFKRKSGIVFGDTLGVLKSLLHSLFNGDVIINDIVDIIRHDLNCSVRTRLVEVEGKTKTILVFKQGKDATNGNSRKEFEIVIEGDKLTQLDTSLLITFFNYQAKWSRERESYKLGDFTITLDRNAGYGWLCEVELVVKEDEKTGELEASLHQLMDKLDLEELPKDRLNRMFDFYNKNWNDFYGTENYFVIH